MEAPRVVFDSMVFLQGAVSPAGPAFACLRLAETGRVNEVRKTTPVTRDVLDFGVESLLRYAELSDESGRPGMTRCCPVVVYGAALAVSKRFVVTPDAG